jgi:ankyrin repeat protein
MRYLIRLKILFSATLAFLTLGPYALVAMIKYDELHTKNLRELLQSSAARELTKPDIEEINKKIETLVILGADPNVEYFIATHGAAWSKSGYSPLSFLFVYESKRDIDARNSHNEHTLASSFGSFIRAPLELLLNHGADFNIDRIMGGETPLRLALLSKQFDVVFLLISLGAKIGPLIYRDISALCCNKNANFLKRYFSDDKRYEKEPFFNFCIRRKDQPGLDLLKTPHEKKEHDWLLSALIFYVEDVKADLQKQNRSGTLDTEWIITNREALIKSGKFSFGQNIRADLQRRDKWGTSAFDIALVRRNREVILSLLDLGIYPFNQIDGLLMARRSKDDLPYEEIYSYTLRHFWALKNFLEKELSNDLLVVFFTIIRSPAHWRDMLKH